MAEQIKKTKKSSSKKEEQATTDVVAEESTESEELKQRMDDLLDEIDEVLETNAADFVRNYIQKGGE